MIYQLLVTGQALAFGAMQAALLPVHGGTLPLGYGLFPFVIAAQLGIFPRPCPGSVQITPFVVQAAQITTGIDFALCKLGAGARLFANGFKN